MEAEIGNMIGDCRGGPFVECSWPDESNYLPNMR